MTGINTTEETGIVGTMAAVLFVQQLVAAGADPAEIYAALGNKKRLAQAALHFQGDKGNVSPLRAKAPQAVSA